MPSIYDHIKLWGDHQYEQAYIENAIDYTYGMDHTGRDPNLKIKMDLDRNKSKLTINLTLCIIK